MRFIPASLTATFVVVSLSSAASANLLSNPGFEMPDASAGDVAGLPGWIEFGAPGTRFATTSNAFSGAQSLKMFGPFDFLGGGTGMFQAFPAAPGETWVAEVMALNSSLDPIGAGNFAAMKIEFLDAGGALVAGGLLGVDVFEVIVADSTSPTDSWMFSGLGTAPAPAGTALAQIVLVHVQGGTAITGGSVFLDDASLIPTPMSASPLGIGGLALLRRRR